MAVGQERFLNLSFYTGTCEFIMDPLNANRLNNTTLIEIICTAKQGPVSYKQASSFTFSSILAAMTASFFMRREDIFKILRSQTLLDTLQDKH
jgi:hypothetical protein